MGTITSSFLTEEDYHQIHAETGCKWTVLKFTLFIVLSVYFKVNEQQVRRLYQRFSHLDKRSKGYLV